MAEFEKKVYVRDLKEQFHLRQVSGNEDALNRWIVVPDVNRPGLELSGYLRENDLKRVTIIGNKECEYIKTLPNGVKRERFEMITDAYTPCIIISGANDVPDALLEIANERNFPILLSDDKTYRIVVQLIAFLDERLAPSESYHGVMMSIYGVGVLLKGHSGVGKSELALDLIRRGHMLVADDRVDICRVHNELLCKSPEILKNMLEIRGVGVLDVSLAFGSTTTLDQSKLDFVIELVPFKEDMVVNRIGVEKSEMIEILGLERPLLTIPVKEGRAMGVIIESAVANFRLLEKGISSAKIFDERVVAFINKNKES